MCLQPLLFSCAESSPNHNAEIAEVQKLFFRPQKCHPESPRHVTSFVLFKRCLWRVLKDRRRCRFAEALFYSPAHTGREVV